MTNVADQTQYLTDLAQWCVNVVDFRDADCINTSFEFDLNPLDGWAVDGDIASDEGIPDRLVVWGAERPELLLTESFAMHDKRTEDRNDDDGGGDYTSNNGGNDTNFDSHYVPNASAFFEIYNPWYHSDNTDTNANSDFYPPELYGNGGVALDRLAPGGAPVWRVRVIHHRESTNGNFDNPGIVDADGSVLRIVYFKEPNDPNLTDTASNPSVAQPEKNYFLQ
ncbi:MAG: hypothetical protein R3C03_15785 [Pirellulaceae bacterium]